MAIQISAMTRHVNPTSSHRLRNSRKKQEYFAATGVLPAEATALVLLPCYHKSLQQCQPKPTDQLSIIPLAGCSLPPPGLSRAAL